MRENLVFFWIGLIGLGVAQLLSVDTGLDFSLLTKLAVVLSLVVWVWDTRLEVIRIILHSVSKLKEEQARTRKELAEICSKSRRYTKDFIYRLRAVYKEIIYKYRETKTQYKDIVSNLKNLSFSELIRYVSWRLLIIFWRMAKFFYRVIKDSSESLIKYVFLEFVIFIRLILALIRAIQITILMLAGDVFVLIGVSLFFVFIDVRMQKWSTTYTVLLIYLIWLGFMWKIKLADKLAFGLTVILLISLSVFRYTDQTKLTEDIATWAFVFFTVGVMLMIIQELKYPESHHERQNSA